MADDTAGRLRPVWCAGSHQPTDNVPAIEVTVTPTRYTVSALPADHIDADLFAITVEWRGRGLWAVVRMSQCLNRDGEWEWEPSPSSPAGREDDFLARCRFTLDTALDLARQAAPQLTINGFTVADVLAKGGDRG